MNTNVKLGYGALIALSIFGSGCIHTKISKPGAVADESQFPIANGMEMHSFTSSAPSHRFNWAYLGRQTDDGDLGPASAWCDTKGDWGVSAHISNHSIWGHYYYVVLRLGHKDAAGNFTEFHRVTSSKIYLKGHHDEADTTGSGLGVPQIISNFSAINSATLQLQETQAP
jgi:hypothetical protein